jgi:hypothetical protein
MSLPALKSRPDWIRALVAALGRWETDNLVQISRLLDHDDKLYGNCAPKYSPPAVLDDFTNGGDYHKQLVRPDFKNTKVFKFAQQVSLVKVTSEGIKRLEGTPDGRGNAVFEYALGLGDKQSLGYFSVTFVQHFLGFRLRDVKAGTIPAMYKSVTNLRDWYEKACYDENGAVEPANLIEAAYWSHCSQGDIKCYKEMLTNSHTQNANTSETYWTKGMSGWYAQYLKEQGSK